MKTKFVISVKRAENGQDFEVYSEGSRIEENKESKIIAILKDNLEQSLTSNKDVMDRRKFIAYNDTLKGTDQYIGSSKLAKKFGVSIGTISVDRKVIAEKGIIGEAPAESISEPTAEETKTGKKTKKNNKKGKSK